MERRFPRRTPQGSRGSRPVRPDHEDVTGEAFSRIVVVVVIVVGLEQTRARRSRLRIVGSSAIGIQVGRRRRDERSRSRSRHVLVESDRVDSGIDARAGG